MPQTGRRTSGTRWPIVFLVSALVGSYYLWAVRAAGVRFDWKHDSGDYYALLGRGFASGHLYLPVQPSPQLLAQPDPWDPAVLLFAPWRFITGHDLPQGFAMFLLCFGGFLFSCGSLLRILDLASVGPSRFVLGMLLLALGVCQSVPYLLNRVAVYEIAIGGGYFGLSAAVFCLTRGIRSPYSPYWL